jgi:c-di-GMP-binding flagellar brake protein YcgR
VNSYKRSSQRYHAYLDVEIGNSALPLKTTNISLGGTQLTCGRMQGDMLLESEKFRGNTVDIKLSLNANMVCFIKCEVRHFTLYDEDEYLIGIKFLEFIDNSLELLVAFINENEGKSLRPVK